MTPDDKFETPEQTRERIEEQIVESVPEPETVLIPEPETVLIVEEEPAAPEAQQLAAAVARADRQAYAGMFGVPEIAGVVISGLILLMVLGFYFLALVPAQSDLKNKKAQLDELEKKRIASAEKFKNFDTTKNFVANLEQSVIDFEYRHLPISSIGRTALYDRLNGLMTAYNLRNTAGPEYSPLEIKEFKPDQPREERGRSKFESLFPGDYINMTVEGSYVNMRRFIREIEASQQFIVISSIELEAAENTQQEARNPAAPPPGGMNPMNPTMSGGGQPTQSAPQKGKTHGEVVSLHMELAAYFRREAAPVKTLTP